MFTSKHFGPINDDRLGSLSGPQLLQLHHELEPESKTKRFSSRSAGIRRVKDELDAIGIGVANYAEKQQKADKKAGPTRVSYSASEKIKSHRPNTRRGRIIRLMSRPEGASVSEMCDETKWSEEDLRVTLKMIHIYLGHGLEEDNSGRIRITGRPRDRKAFNLKRAEEIRGHRPATKRAATLALLERTEGATMAEVQEATGWNVIQAFQGVTLINTYLGHGLREDEDGRIYLND